MSATLAQLVEQLICNQQVDGSSPPGGSPLKIKELARFFVNSFFYGFRHSFRPQFYGSNCR